MDREWRTVERKSSGPLRPWRRLRARRTASLRESGWSDLRSATSSSRVACITSMSSGSGLRSDLARASLPRSATSRRRISFSISWRSWSMRDWYSSRSSRSSSAVSVAIGSPRLRGRVVVERGGGGPGRLHQPVQHPVEVEVPQRPVEVVGPPHRAARPPCPRSGTPPGGPRRPPWRRWPRAAPCTAGRPAPRGSSPPGRRRRRPGPGPVGRPSRPSRPSSASEPAPESSPSSSIRYSGPRSEK